MTLDHDRSRTRFRRRRQWLIALAVLTATTGVAGTAFAGDRQHSRHHGFSGHHGGQHGRHHGGHQRRHRYGFSVLHHRSYPVYVHGYSGYSGYAHREPAYYCAPCSHRFGSYDALSRHVHHRHHVPLWKLPFVIVDSVLGGIFGWIFHG